MRIRKLAKDLETEESALMELLRGLGHVRYTDPEQQLPGPVEAQVRRHARDLPKAAPPKPLPVAGPRPVPEGEPDMVLFERAMATVRPIGGQPKSSPRASRSAPAPAPPPRPQPHLEPHRGKVPEIGAPRRGPAATAPPAAPAPRPVAAGPTPSTPPVAQSSVAAATVAAHRAEEQARVEALEARLAATEARLEASVAREAEAVARAEALADAGSIPEPVGTASLGTCFERRGLLGEDEIASALRALLDGRRAPELLRIRVAEPGRLEDMLWERILLLAEDEPTPPGVVAVRVPPERSEGPQSSTNRAAMSRFSTACLVHNIKCIVIVGGSLAYHRTLREGLDQRLDLRLIPGHRQGRVPPVPSADLVILWASRSLDPGVASQFPQGMVIAHRSIARMLGAATEWIEAQR